MSYYCVERELSKSDIINDWIREKYKGDVGYALADNPFIIEAIENAIQNEFPELFDQYSEEDE